MQPSIYPQHGSWPMHPASTTGYAGASPTRLYDFSGLGKLSNDADFVREMQQMFVERVPGQINELQSTINAEDWETIAQRAHSLKATFGNLRMEPGTTLLKEMEHLARQRCGKLELSAMLQVISSTADAVVSAFRQQLNLAA